VETVAPLFTALIGLALAVEALIRSTRDRLHQEFAFLAAVLSIVFLCLFFLVLTEDPGWRYGLLTSALLIAPASLQVYGSILGRSEGLVARSVPLLYVAAAVQMGALFLLGAANRVVLLSNGLVVWGGLTIQALWVLGVLLRVKRPVERRRLAWLLGFGVAALTTMGLEMAFIDWNFFAGGKKVLFPPFGSLVVAGYVWFLGQIIQSNRLLEGREVVGKVIVFGLMALVLAAVYGVLVRLIGSPPGPFAEAVDILIASLLVLILYEPMKSGMDRQMERLFAADRFAHVQSLATLQRRMPGLIQVDRMVEALFDGTMNTGRVDLVSVYVYDDGRDGYRLLRWEGETEQDLLPLFPQHPFIDGFLEGRDRYLLEALEAGLGRAVDDGSWNAVVPRTMGQLQADLTLPLRVGNSILGVWNLRLAPGSESFSGAELRLLGGIADQAAVLVDNSRAFEAMKERDRLATLGEMSAGLAHEIRNPLGAIKGAVSVLGRQQPGSAASSEFLGIIVEEVDRLDGVVRQFLDYARPMHMRVDDVPPDMLLRGVLAMVRAQGLPPNIEVAYQESDVEPVTMDVEQIKQVVLNIVLNGIDAMSEGGGTLRVWARERRRTTDSLRSLSPTGGPDVWLKRGSVRAGGAVELIVEDQGGGIEPDAAGKLFIPFFTTKAQGTGLGLAICERIVREHGGEIEIESTLGGGSRFTVRLPRRAAPTPEEEPTERDQEAGPG
jgi:two-component system sensor histidine kinase HydH